MSKIIGIDVGLSKTGVAIAEGMLAVPHSVIHEKDLNRLVIQIQKLAVKEDAQKVVIGIPEGELVTYVNALGESLIDLGIDVEFHDETLSTHDAQALAIEAGMPQGKRNQLEDAMAASVMLQSYLTG